MDKAPGVIYNLVQRNSIVVSYPTNGVVFFGFGFGISQFRKT